MEKLCWSCQHVYYCQADGGYSEYTPGSDFGLGCIKGHWYFEPYDDTLKDFRRKLLMAQTCEDFVKRDDHED